MYGSEWGPHWIPDGSKTLQEHFPSCCVAVVHKVRVMMYHYVQERSRNSMMDLNGDEEISVEEWMKFNSHFDIDRDHAAKSFDALDEDKDGTIDRMEFFRNYIEFWRGTNENHPSRLIFGPI